MGMRNIIMRSNYYMFSFFFVGVRIENGGGDANVSCCCLGEGVARCT